MVKTITLAEEMSFEEALKNLLDGKCLGIRPDQNLRYVELYRPKWLISENSHFFLKWERNEDAEDGIRADQYLGKWRLVVLDYRRLKE